jgi:hypothetical protein
MLDNMQIFVQFNIQGSILTATLGLSFFSAQLNEQLNAPAFDPAKNS